MKYLYTPKDFAVFFLVSDFSWSYERVIINDVFHSKINLVPVKYRKNKKLFFQHIYNEISKFDGTLDDEDFIALTLLLRDTDQPLQIEYKINSEKNFLERYFKIIKFELLYIKDRDYKKVKLRRLLKVFGYKRRSQKLIENIKRTLSALGLSTYLKNHIPCNIAEINIDDMIIIRLK